MNIKFIITQYYKRINFCKGFFYSISLFLILFLFYIGLSPLATINEISKLVNSDTIFIQNFDSIYSAPELKQLVSEKAFKEAKASLLSDDSIHLIVDLHDSIIGLSINGVVIHKTKFHDLNSDPLLNRLPNMYYVKLFSNPLSIEKQIATIVKEPIVVRHAPKDTVEAALNVYKPDTLVQNPAFLILKLNYHINLFISQDQNPAFNDKWVQFIFKSTYYARTVLRNARNFIFFKKPIYEPVIFIKVPANDLRSIYRALPENAKVMLFI